MANGRKRSRRKRGGEIPNTEGKELVIVESPAKARTINKYLGPGYSVAASVGHVRDLPDKNPKGVKAPVPGVDLENNFEPTYEVIKGKAGRVKELREAAKKASGVWLATDLDREGEAIAWHLAQALGLKLEDCKRVVFNAITKREIHKAFQEPRLIDMNKVNAQQARRILDRIVGYQVSPLLWKKVARGLSAGRVQSVAVRLVVEREREIEQFQPEEYWRVVGYFTPRTNEAPHLEEKWRKWLEEFSGSENARESYGPTAKDKNRWLAEHDSFSAELIEIDGKKFKPKDMNAAIEASRRAGFHVDKQVKTGSSKDSDPATIRLVGHMEESLAWKVKSIQTKRTRSRPFAPFITSTLQQAAANQLGFTAHATMAIAQSLYEGVPVRDMGLVGLITYMRTDSTYISPQAVGMVRDYIGSYLGEKYLPKRPNVFQSSNKEAQEAHEAIRPTDVDLTPEKVRPSLDERQYKLYKLIWERFVACQMTDAQWDATTVLISGSDEKGELVFRATGRILVFDGYYRVVGVPSASEEARLPELWEDQPVASIQIDPTQHFTSPPPRYTEASLVKKLESEGIGRPSTYAQIIQVIQDRRYVEKVRNRFHATDLGKVVTDKLTEAFPRIIDVGYTREMERELDDIEERQADWVDMLNRFYGPFKKSLDAAYEELEHAKAEIEPSPHKCPKCGSQMVYRFGRNGRFLSCSRYPECKYSSPIDRNGKPASPQQTDVCCPKCGQPMTLRRGRFGPFLSCSRYPSCDGVLNLDKKGRIRLPKAPPLATDLSCPQCKAPLNLRRGSKGPWLGCSRFPKCRGRLSWTSLKEETRAKWEKALRDHEEAHSKEVVYNSDGMAVEDGYEPKFQEVEGPAHPEADA